MPARDDDGKGMRRQLRAREPCRNLVDDDFCGGRKTLAVRELFSVVHDVHAEPHFLREAREVKPDVARADYVQLGRGFDWLDVYVHLPAADEPRLLREVV